MISGIAAWVSYWHMTGVAAHYGETDTSPYLPPVSVDGLIVVASICLVELAGRIRDAEAPSAAPVAMIVPARLSHQDGPAMSAELSPPSRTLSASMPTRGNGATPTIGALTR